MVAPRSSITRNPAKALAPQAFIGSRIVIYCEERRLKDDAPNLYGLEGKDLKHIRVEALHVDYEERCGGYTAVWQQVPQLAAAGARRVSRAHIRVDYPA